jgi:hypothetical protein
MIEVMFETLALTVPMFQGTVLTVNVSGGGIDRDCTRLVWVLDTAGLNDGCTGSVWR